MNATEEQESTPIFAELAEQFGFGQDTSSGAEGKHGKAEQPAAEPQGETGKHR
ncbi:hypothetical protein [Amycolatopsis anabasis]|uniref:hypothetical protein n=1 Tax=Amycolatopsis anabasis TaxID=1840409 RepID=UPI00131C8814|nr:hypothetical protein [Amycolatopsis anabasis]